MRRCYLFPFLVVLGACVEKPIVAASQVAPATASVATVASTAPSASASSSPSASAAPTAAPEEPLPVGAIQGLAGTCVCAKHRIEWGGTPCMCSVATATLKGCRSFTRQTTMAGFRCEGLLSCDPTKEGSVPAIERVMAHEDVVRALARAPVVFGRANETREGSDGFRIAVDGKTITVFPSCETAGDRPCEEAPPGVRSAFRYLQKQPLAHETPSACF